MAAQPNRPAFPLDRHLAAFLASRLRTINFKDLCDLNKPQREIRNMAALRILAAIQNNYKVKNLQNLSQWMADLCTPILTHYHNLKARAKAREETDKAISNGQLAKLAKLLESRRDFIEDESDYQSARIEILLIESEIKEIESRITNHNQTAVTYMSGIMNKLVMRYNKIFQSLHCYNNKKRITKLYKKSDNLRETWGESIVPAYKGMRHFFINSCEKE